MAYALGSSLRILFCDAADLRCAIFYYEHQDTLAERLFGILRRPTVLTLIIITVLIS